MSSAFDSDSEWKITESGKIRRLKEGLIHVEISPGWEQSPENAEENLRISGEFCEHKPLPVLLDLRGTKPLPPRTRTIYVAPEIAKTYSAIAMITSADSMSRLMANVYMLTARMPIPVKLFHDLEDGKKWLQQFVK